MGYTQETLAEFVGADRTTVGHRRAAKPHLRRGHGGGNGFGQLVLNGAARAGRLALGRSTKSDRWSRTVMPDAVDRGLGAPGPRGTVGNTRECPRIRVNAVRYGTAVASAWNQLHPRLTRRGAWSDHDGPLPVITGSIIELRVQRLPGDRHPKPVWLWYSRPEPAPADVDRLWQAFLRRFDIEHTFR
ncbi:MAG: NF041680 family putative transposase, partial [Pseudonocardiaceae bacterium]